MKAPCLDCADRVVGCHSSCERYIAYAEECARIRRKRQLDRAASAPSHGQEVLGAKKLNDLKAGRRTDKR